MIINMLIVLCSVVIGIPRLMGEHGQFYQAIAHLWVGGLLGGWIAVRLVVLGHRDLLARVRMTDLVLVQARWLLGLAAALTIVEIIMFLIERFGPNL